MAEYGALLAINNHLTSVVNFFMESGETIFIGTQGDQKVGTINSANRSGSSPEEKFIILLEEDETIDDGEHFMSEFEPAVPPAKVSGSRHRQAGTENYLKLNRGNGY